MMELMMPGDEFLSAFNNTCEPASNPLATRAASGPEYFLFNMPDIPSTVPSPWYNRDYSSCDFNPPMTPLTPSADVPESPFDVFTNYNMYKQPDNSENTDYTNMLNTSYPPSRDTSYTPSTAPPPYPPPRDTSYTPSTAPPPYPGPSPSHRQPICINNLVGCYLPNIGLEAEQGSRDNLDIIVDNSLILRAEEAYNSGMHDDVLQILKSHSFDKSHHEQLQHLWLAAVYAKESLQKKKHLTAVDRYRLRKRFPFPQSIWEGEKTIYCLKKSARESLTNFFADNAYPTPVEKRKLATKCDLSYVQISNWFKNKRMREKDSCKR